MKDELLRIEYGLDRMLWQDPDQNQLDVWRVELQRGDADDRTEDGVRWGPIAEGVLYGIDTQRCRWLDEAPFEVADSHSAEAAYYYEQVFDADGEFQPDVEEQFAWAPSRALFLHDVSVDVPLRRRGYGSLLVADALLTLAAEGTAVFAHPGPTDRGPPNDDDVARLRSETENTRFLASLGFQPLRDRMWLLDLATEAALETLAALRR